MNINHQIHSIDRIAAEAKAAALRYNDINDACPYPFGSVAAFVFKQAFNAAIHENTKEIQMSRVKLVWVTPDTDSTIAYIARVSNPEGQDKPIGGLLTYMMQHGHVSPFEMAGACIEINTTRDIGRQILRHRSFSFQEFSQRYQDATLISEGSILRECRLQDKTNRQSSTTCTEPVLVKWWNEIQSEQIMISLRLYKRALSQGIAKEQARALLPEGLTPTRMYMSGTFRSWIHYLQSRLDPSTQAEHREVAQQVLTLLRAAAPEVIGAFFPE